MRARHLGAAPFHGRFHGTLREREKVPWKSTLREREKVPWDNKSHGPCFHGVCGPSWSVPVFIAMVLYATVLYLMLPRAERRIAFSGEQKIEL